MHRSTRLILGFAALSALTATLAGAYASHGLAGRLAPLDQAAFRTAVEYQFYHSIGLGLVGLWHAREPRSRPLAVAALALATGLVLFCGGIYATTLGAPRAIGMLVPVGGVAFMVGWLALALAALLSAKA